jgi:tRNA threonylcarbamoyladenosine biosynthesis protein TsaE
MPNHTFIAKHEAETMQIGAKLASFLQLGDVITLEGELGAGKTTFVKGLAKGLDIGRTVSSPTFTIIKEYEGRFPLYHIDAYRLEFSEEDLGLEEYIYGTGITVIEWAQFIEEELPENRLAIEIQYTNNQMRELIFKATGEHYETVIDELFR